jgi:large subunit ribosomal protein L24
MKTTATQKRFSPKLKIKKGDTVVVISGASRGKQGKVLEVFPSDNKALVEGVNMIHRHTKPTGQGQTQKGGIIKKEARLDISKLKVVVGGQPTRIGRREENGKIVRYAKTTGEVIR